MMRQWSKRSGEWGIWLPAAAFAFAALVLMSAGCGEQDLYKPPRSPWQVVGRIALPSINEDVSILGDHAFVAGGEAGLHVIDISNPANPVLIATVDTKKYAESVKTASIPTTLGIVDIAFVVEGTEGVTTYNVTRPDSSYSFQQGTTAVDGNGLFVEIPENPQDPTIVYLAESWKGIRIFETNAYVPGLLDYLGVFSGTRGFAKSISVADGYAYVADDEMGLSVLDVHVRSLGSVRVVRSLDTPGKATGIDVRNGYAYIADGLNGLVVMRIYGNDQDPEIVGRLALPGTCRSIIVWDQTAFIAAQDGGVHIVDVTNPAVPVLLGQIATTYATGVSVNKDGIVAISDRVDGLVILSGPRRFSDTIAPGLIDGLTASTFSMTKIRLNWPATGNDRYNGTASQYDIRYSTETITDEKWANATQCTGEPAPKTHGSAETFKVPGLTASTTYYFAMRTGDAAGNWSGISNVAVATTAAANLPPTLSGGTVTPEVGEPDVTLFAYEVTYADGDGDIPLSAEVYIVGSPHGMTKISGDLEDGAVFRGETTLPIGNNDYTFYFKFNDGHEHEVQSATFTGPYFGVSFTMGSPQSVIDSGLADPDETEHTVVLTRRVDGPHPTLLVEDHEVSQGEYLAVIGTNPSIHQGPNRPVENVTWLDAVRYCNQRSAQEQPPLTPAYDLSGPEVVWNRNADGWRLPTEAEWEYACRAGATSMFFNGTTSDTLLACVDRLGNVNPVVDAIAWFCGNAGTAGHHDEGLKAANAFGLHDMTGNVWEWCWDWYGPLGSGIALDPAGPANGTERVRRGGSWFDYARYCRSASRDAYYPNSKDDVLGFRVVRNLP
jgi:formylglycine-generating enzyme required for sulfatase activity